MGFTKSKTYDRIINQEFSIEQRKSYHKFFDKVFPNKKTHRELEQERET